MTLNKNQNSSNSTIGIENYFNAKSNFIPQCDLIRDMPSLRSFACTLNDNGFKEMEKQYKGKWKLEQAYNKN